MQLENQFLKLFSDNLSDKYVQAVRFIEEQMKKEQVIIQPSFDSTREALDRISDRLASIQQTHPQKVSSEIDLEVVEHIVENQERIFTRICDFQQQICQKLAEQNSFDVARSLKKIRFYYKRIFRTNRK